MPSSASRTIRGLAPVRCACLSSGASSAQTTLKGGASATQVQRCAEGTKYDSLTYREGTWSSSMYRFWQGDGQRVHFHVCGGPGAGGGVDEAPAGLVVMSKLR